MGVQSFGLLYQLILHNFLLKTPNLNCNKFLESSWNDTHTFQNSKNSKLLSKRYSESKLRRPTEIQISITSSSKFQISILMTFWRASTVTHAPSKFQCKMINTQKVMACLNLRPLNGWPRVFTNSNPHNFCKSTPNPTCKHSLESSQHKEQPPKISNAQVYFSILHSKSKFGFKTLITQKKNSLSPLHTLSFFSHTLFLLGNSSLTFHLI